MKKKLFQLLGDGIEELYEVPHSMEKKEFIRIYREWESIEREETFEEWIQSSEEYHDIERVFVEEIYV